MSRMVAIVDGSSSAMLLAPAFARSGFTCLHVQSTPTPLQVFTGSIGFRPADYVGNIIHTGDFARTLKAVAESKPDLILAGVESGVDLAEQLSWALHLPTNAPDDRRARRNKQGMKLALEDRGLRTIPTLVTRSAEGALTWILREGGLPAVVKPLESCGSDGVTLCHQADHVKHAFTALLDRPNALGILNSELLVQPYVGGTEYIVDTVSAKGRHCVTDVWRYQKQAASDGGSFVYDHAWLLSYAEGRKLELYDYTFDALNAVGIRNGPAHCEIILSERGPVLVDVGARLCGGLVPLLCRAAIGSSQIEATVEAYADERAFRERLKEPYQLQSNALRVLLLSPHGGTLASLPLIDQVRALPSFHAIHMSVDAGSKLKKTTDFFSHPGKVDLVHESREVISRDMERIRELESDGFYVLEGGGGS